LNVVNNYGYSPLLIAVLRSFDGVKDFLVANGAILCTKSRKRLTRLSKIKRTSNVCSAKIDKDIETRVAEIIADLFFGGESCEYLKSLKDSERGRFDGSYYDSRPRSWFFWRPLYEAGIVSFGVILGEVKIWLSENGNICDIKLIEQAAKDKLNKFKFLEEESCAICYSNKPSVTFFPCGHKVLCSDCQKISQEDYSEGGCACCRQKIIFYKIDDTKPKKTFEVAEKLTKMTLRKR